MEEKEKNRINTVGSDNNENEKIENPTHREWESLFLALTKLAEKTNRQPNSIQVTGLIKNEDQSPFDYELRINPAILSNKGKLEIIVLDLSYRNTPIQQWVGKAEWFENKPAIKNIDMFLINRSANGLFGLGDIAIFAQGLVRKKMELVDSEIEIQELNSIMAGDYSKTTQ